MWNKPWGLREGLCIGAGLFVTGLLLQALLSPIEWYDFAAPVNVVLLAGYLILIVLIHLLRRHTYLFRWLSSSTAAASALAWVVTMTVIMGLTRQLPAEHSAATLPGFSQMLSNWSFVLIYLWLTTSLALTILRAGFPLQWSKISFWLNHAGLFIALVGATLGNADMQRLKMTTRIGSAEWRAADEKGTVHELPLAIELQEFTIDEYPPKLMLVDNASGKVIPAGKPEHILLEAGVRTGQLPGWDVSVEELLPVAASVATQDTVRFTEFHSMGATTAALVRAKNKTNCAIRQGWVSCGSFLFPYKALRLDDDVSLVMPDREPRRFASVVRVFTQSGLTQADTIEVNLPMCVEGWKIYQLSYDETKGRWSDVSIFELVRDPWLPYVYTGIWMMIVGAVCMFVQFGKRKEVRP